MATDTKPFAGRIDSISREGKGIKVGGTWYDFSKQGDEAKLAELPGIKVGAQVKGTFTLWQKDNITRRYIRTLEVVEAAPERAGGAGIEYQRQTHPEDAARMGRCAALTAAALWTATRERYSSPAHVIVIADVWYRYTAGILKADEAIHALAELARSLNADRAPAHPAAAVGGAR